jgi:hypothetical protein
MAEEIEEYQRDNVVLLKESIGSDPLPNPSGLKGGRGGAYALG